MRLRRARLLTLVVIAGMIAYACYALWNMKTKVAQAAETEAQLQRQIQQIQEENAALQYAIDNQNDEKVIEDIARNRLGLVLPEEQIFYDTGE